MVDEVRPFVIEVRRRWLLWILPIIATMYFIAVVVLTIVDYRIRGVTTEMLALAGVGLFVLVMAFELPFFLRRRAPRAPKPAKVKKARRPEAESSPSSAYVDDELTTTNEKAQGLQVVEYSSPAKSRNQSTVYTKTYIPVSGAHVVRVETAVADASDI